MRPLRILWALPNTLLGLVLVPLAWIGGGGVRAVDGVLEASGGVLGRLLSRLPPVPGGVAALALGHVVLGRDPTCLERTRAHERAHVRQAERWGPLFLPAYGLAGLWALARGGHAYRDNPFERAARACEDRRR